MIAYLDLLRKIMDRGVTVQTGAYLPSLGRHPTAKRLHGEQLRFDLRDGFPAVTTKPLFWRGVVAEWIWFMRGDTNITWLRDVQGVHIWDQWADADGYLGPVYGAQFRAAQGVKWQKRAPVQPPLEYDDVMSRGKRLDTGVSNRTISGEPWTELYAVDGYLYGVSEHEGILDAENLGVHHEVVETDQIANAVKDIRAVSADPFNRARRRIIVSLWNPAQVPDMALPPCHTFHFYDLEPSPMAGVDDRIHGVRGDAYRGLDPRWTLNLHLCARSIDAVKGLPFNIASYALMLEVMALVTGTKAGTLTITFNDVHIYDNQFDDVAEQLQRLPMRAPRLSIDPAEDVRLTDICPDLSIEQCHRLEPGMFKLVGYKHHAKLKSESEVAV